MKTLWKPEKQASGASEGRKTQQNPKIPFTTISRSHMMKEQNRSEMF
jgi:hypothetical protein